MPKSKQTKITVVSTFTSKNFGNCASTVKVDGDTKAIERVNKQLLGNNEWSAKDKVLVTNWARQSLKGAEYNRYKADKAGWSQEVKAKLSKKINRLRALIEALTGEAMAVTKATKPKTKTKAKSSAPQGWDALTPEMQQAFMAIISAKSKK